MVSPGLIELGNLVRGKKETSEHGGAHPIAKAIALSRMTGEGTGLVDGIR